MEEPKRILQLVPMVIVMPAPDVPPRIVRVDLSVTLFANGDWRVDGPDERLRHSGPSDTFERSIARFLLDVRDLAVGSHSQSHDGINDINQSAIVTEETIDELVR